MGKKARTNDAVSILHQRYVKDDPGRKDLLEQERSNAAEIARLVQEIDRLKDWVNDLHSGMYINCVYCGHRYGPNTEVPASMADVLKEHVEQCPEHPMSKLKEENLQVRDYVGSILNHLDEGEYEEARQVCRNYFEECIG